MSRWDVLRERAKWESLTSDEVDEVASELRSWHTASDVSRYTLIYILGKARGFKHRDLIESFLDAQDDPMLARIALQTLCHFWGDTDQYLDRVTEFVRGVDWDEDGEVRQIAMSSAGDYLKVRYEPELLSEILRIVTDETEPSSARSDAYQALLLAMGVEWRDLPLPRLDFDFKRDVDPAILNGVRNRLQQSRC